jgi:hypothetical protein
LNAAHGNAQRWCQPEKKTAEERGTNSENKYPPVQMDLIRARQAAWPKRNKRVNADECEAYAEQASSDAQDCAFRKALTRQAATPSPQCYTHGKLPLA